MKHIGVFNGHEPWTKSIEKKHIFSSVFFSSVDFSIPKHFWQNCFKLLYLLHLLHFYFIAKILVSCLDDILNGNRSSTVYLGFFKNTWLQILPFIVRYHANSVCI